MADNTLEIRLVESSQISRSPPAGFGNGSNGVSGGQSFGAPQTFNYQAGTQPPGGGLLSVTNQILSLILADVRRIASKTAAPDTEEQKKLEEKKGIFDKLTRFVESSLTVLARTMDVMAMRTQKTTEAAVARIRNEEQEALIAERERRGLTQVAAMRAAAEAAGAVPKVSVFGNSIDAGPAARAAGMKAADAMEAKMRLDIKEMQEMITVGRAMRDRTRELSRYDSGLGRAMAVGDVNRQRRDVGEAQILSGHLSEVEMRQQQLEKVNQQLGILAKMQESGEQVKRINSEMEKRQKELNEKLDGLPADMARKIRELGNEIKDPFDLLEAAGGFAGSGFEMARQENDLAARQQAARLNIPLLGGLE